LNELENVARTIVGNLHQSYLYRVLTEWHEKDTLKIREELGISSYSETIANPTDLFEKVRRHILTTAFQDNETIEFLMDIPKWVGYQIDTDFMDTGEQTIQSMSQGILFVPFVSIAI
jgi:hypothetical protein